MSLRIIKSETFRGTTDSHRSPSNPPPQGKEPPDTYLSRLVKMIPAEAVALYGAGFGVIPKTGESAGPPDPALALLIWCFVCAAAIVLIRIRATRSGASQKPQWSSIVIALVSFVVWLYALGGPFEAYEIKPEKDYIGPLVMMAWTFFVPYFYKGD